MRAPEASRAAALEVAERGHGTTTPHATETVPPTTASGILGTSEIPRGVEGSLRFGSGVGGDQDDKAGFTVPSPHVGDFLATT